MSENAGHAFISYSRADSDFVLRLAKDLKAQGNNVWLDQIDIRSGDQWDRAIEKALLDSKTVIVILSPAAVNSANVLDEVSLALDKGKSIIPVMLKECSVPLRLTRIQRVEFRDDYGAGLYRMCVALGQSPHPAASATLPIGFVLFCLAWFAVFSTLIVPNMAPNGDGIWSIAIFLAVPLIAFILYGWIRYKLDKTKQSAGSPDAVPTSHE